MIDGILNQIDNIFSSVKENKTILFGILVLLSIYNIYFNKNITERAINLFSNNLFKLVIFIIITYISNSNPAIGISLAIIMLASLQIISNIKIEKEIKNEKFSQMEPVDMSYLNDEYLTNPLKTQQNLSPPTNFDLNLTTPNDLYIEMIKKGKMLLDDSYNMDKDLANRYDIREKQISNITKRNGIELVDSGINRLQKADQGEYNMSMNSNNSNNLNKYIKYDKLIESNSTNPAVLAIYNELLNNYDILVSKQLDFKEFNTQLEKVYLNELELLETIYKYKKNSINFDKQKIIDNEINLIKQLKNETKKWQNKLKNLSNLIE